MVAYHDDEWGTPVDDDDRVVRATGARIIPGRTVVVDDPSEARGVSRSVRGLRPRCGSSIRRCRRRATDGRCRDRPEPGQDPGDDRERTGVPRDGRGVRNLQCVPGQCGATAGEAPARGRDLRLGPGNDRGLRPPLGRPPTARDSGSSVPRSSMRSCRAWVSSTTTPPAAFDTADRRDTLAVTAQGPKVRA